MSRKISVTKERRGPTLRVIISVMQDLHFTRRERLATGPIDVDGLALIIGKFNRGDTYGYFDFHAGMKKSAAAKNLAVSISISMGTYERQFLCSDEWVEVAFPDRYYACSLCFPDRVIQSYTAVIYVTAYVTMPTPTVLNNHLYEDTESTDFQLHAADGTVAVHKAVLAFHSDMLKTMLRGDWKENKESRVNIEGVTVQTLQHLKQYMYLGTLPDDGLESLLLIAVRCLMEKLEADCITEIVKSLKPENFHGVIEFACQNNLPQLVKALVLGVPDSIVNSVHSVRHLKFKEQESSDTK